MINVGPLKAELQVRIDVITRLLDSTHGGAASVHPHLDVSREARGLSVLLLFAAYENLMKSLCRVLLERASRLRVSNSRLKPGFKMFAIYGKMQAMSGSGSAAIWKEHGLKLIEEAESTSVCTVDVALFPTDGSFMKTTQVQVICRLFGLGDPGRILREVWGCLDTIVTQRNGIAHGGLTPGEVGRGYSIADIRLLVSQWMMRWSEFLDEVQTRASSRDFYRRKR